MKKSHVQFLSNVRTMETYEYNFSYISVGFSRGGGISMKIKKAINFI